MIRNLVSLAVAVIVGFAASPLIPMVLGAHNPWLVPAASVLAGLGGGVVFGLGWWCMVEFGAVPFLTVATEIVLLSTVAFLVLAFGGTLSWTWTAFSLLTGAALVLWAVKTIVQGRISWVKTPLNLLLVLLLAYFLFQLLPLPAAVLNVFQSNTAKAFQYGPPNVPAVAALKTTDSRSVPISLNRTETRDHIFLWTGYLAFFFVFINSITRRQQLGRMLAVVLVAAAVTAVAGFATAKQDERLLYRQYSVAGANDRSPVLNADVPREFSAGYGFQVPTVEGDTVDWYVPKVHTGDVFGGFPSSSSAGTVLVMGLLLSLGCLFAYTATYREEWARSGGLLFTREGNLTLMLGFLALVSAAGLVMTRNRGALGVALFCVAALIVWVAFSRSRRAGILAVVVLAIVFAVPYFLAGHVRAAAGPQIDSFLNPFGEELRMQARQGSWGIIGDFPMFGTGLGTYGDVYPAYKVRGPDLYFAHCDLLQWWAETGLVGMALGAAILGVLAWTVIAGYRKLKDRFFRRLLIATSVAAVAFLLNGLFDFPMQIPGVMILFMTLLGATVIISRDQIARYERDDFLY